MPAGESAQPDGAASGIHAHPVLWSIALARGVLRALAQLGVLGSTCKKEARPAGPRCDDNVRHAMTRPAVVPIAGPLWTMGCGPFVARTVMFFPMLRTSIARAAPWWSELRRDCPLPSGTWRGSEE